MSEIAAPNAILEALGYDERILWVGKPSQRIVRFTQEGVLGLAAFLFFFLPALMHNFFQFNGSGVVTGWFLTWVIVVVFAQTCGPSIVSYYHRRHLFYAISNRRAYIYSTSNGRMLEKSLNLDTPIDYVPGREATIRFEASANSDSSLVARRIWPTHQYDFEFYKIHDGDHVMKIIRQAIRGVE